MKKRIILLTVLLSFTMLTYAFAETKTVIKVGIDTFGKHKASALGFSGTEDVETGLSLSAELLKSINKNLDIGAGITYQIDREQEDYSGDFHFIPIYGLVRLSDAQKHALYGTAHLGFNMFEGDSAYKGSGSLSGGLYYAFGFGFITDGNFQVEALYNVNEGEYSILGIDADIEYSALTLSVGYVF